MVLRGCRQVAGEALVCLCGALAVADGSAFVPTGFVVSPDLCSNITEKNKQRKKEEEKTERGRKGEGEEA